MEKRRIPYESKSYVAKNLKRLRVGVKFCQTVGSVCLTECAKYGFAGHAVVKVEKKLVSFGVQRSEA